jgi:hypothetical protein
MGEDYGADWVECPRCKDGGFPGFILSDAGEEAVADPALKRLTEQHERILVSLDDLIRAVETASLASSVP